MHLRRLDVRHLRHLFLEVAISQSLHETVNVQHHLLKLLQVVTNRNQFIIIHDERKST